MTNKAQKNTSKRRLSKLFLAILTLVVFSISISPKQHGIISSKYSKQLDLNLSSLKTSSLYELNSNEGKKAFISDIISPENKFHAITVSLDKEQPKNTAVDLYMRYMDENSKWSDFKLLLQDEEDMSDPNTANYFYPIPLSISYQYKIVLSSLDKKTSPKVNAINITTIDARNAKPEKSIWDFFSASLDTPKDFDDLNIVSRKDWGADESLMVYKDEEDIPEPSEMTDEEKEYYEKYGSELKVSKEITEDKNGNIYKWPIDYPEKIKLVVVHHTASDYTDLDDTDGAVNSIYYYHAVSRGWGDIGYNFLIDKDGVIYEGRKNSLDALTNGLPMVVGAHASGFNHGSLGIALLLDAQQSEASLEAIESLVSLTYKISTVYDLDLKSTTKMRGETMNTLIGHRDVGKTKCPGDKLYPLLSDIINLSVGEDDGSSSSNLAYDFQEVSNRSTVSMNPQSKSEIEIKLKNTGTETWKSGIAIILKKDSQAESKIYFTNNIAGKPLSTFYMKEKEVKSGSTATFVINNASWIKSGFANFEGYLSLNGKIKSDKVILFPFYVKKVELTYKVIESKISKSKLSKSESFEANIKIKNTGNIIWNNDKSSMLKIQGGSFHDEQDLSSFGPVKNGGEISIKIKMEAPSKIGKYEEALNFVMADGQSLSDDTLNISFSVIDTNNPISVVSKPSKFYFSPGETYRMDLVLKNDSAKTLNTNVDPKFEIKAIKKSSIKIDKINILTKTIKASQDFKVSFMMTVPDEQGQYIVYLKPTVGGKKVNADYIKINFSVKDKTSLINKEPDIRIAIDSLNIDNPQIKASTDFDLYIGKTKYKDIKKGDIVEVKKNKDLLKLTLPDKTTIESSDIIRFVPEGAGILTIENFNHKPAWDTENKYNDNMYRGILELRIYDSKLKVINELSLENYLKGLGEVSNNSTLEKIKSIMVAARTYALYYILIDNKFKDAPYNLNDDPEVSQKYLGYGLEARSPNIVKAVDSIKGEVVTYNDYLVKTPYFNSTDGTSTKSAQQVWGWTDTPYLVSVPDSLCTSDTFQGHGVGLSGCGAEEMASKLNKSYKEILQYYYTGVAITDLY